MNEKLLKMAREWCLDCWPDEEEYIAAATPEQVERVVARSWDGGLEDFIRTNS